MRNKTFSIVFFSVLLMIAANANSDALDSSSKDKALHKEVCGKSYQSPGPRHLRSKQKQLDCTNENDRNTNQTESQSSEKAKQK